MTADNRIAVPKLGAYLPDYGGVFAGLILGDDGNTYGLIVARKSDYAPISGKYGNRGTKIDGADSSHDGLPNTRAMAAAGSDIATQVIELRIAGFDDWQIPARHQARIAVTNAPSEIPDSWAWTSTQCDAHSAWYQLSNGSQLWYNKGDEGAVFPVRRFSLDEVK